MVKKKNKVVVEVFCLHRHTRNYYVVLLCSSWSSPPSFSFRRESTSESERLSTFLNSQVRGVAPILSVAPDLVSPFCESDDDARTI